LLGVLTVLFATPLVIGDPGDPLTWALAVAGGVAVGVGASYVLFSSRPKKDVKVVSRDTSGNLVTENVTLGDLANSRREMRALMLERDLLSSALMKVYEAENEGRITREEREMIARKYSEQIKSLQGKLKDVELVVEVGELEKLREELVTMFKEKISNIELRLERAKELMGPPPPELEKKEAAAKAEKREKADDLEKAVEKRARPEMTESERRVKEIRDEVMEALTKLEQIDLEKKPQE
jgi:hypothetical protein